jgi:hypothetical protein
MSRRNNFVINAPAGKIAVRSANRNKSAAVDIVNFTVDVARDSCYQILTLLLALIDVIIFNWGKSCHNNVPAG